MADINFVALRLDYTSLLMGLVLLYGVGWLVYSLILSPLAGVPGPVLASVSRLWIAFQLRGGDFEVKQRKLHAKYGKADASVIQVIAKLTRYRAHSAYRA